MIRAVFASFWGIRKSKLPCHATCDRRVATGCLWCTHVFVSLLKQKESHLGNPGVVIGQFIEFGIYLDSFYIMIHLCFNFCMLKRVWIIVGTAKIFAKQNGGRFVEIFESPPFDAPHGLSPCYKGLSRNRNLCCQSARGNRPGAVRYFPEAARS